MAEKPASKEDDEELIIGKITDLTSAFIRLIISLLKFIKIDVPKTAENALGIILLLLFIYLSGGIFKLDLSAPMVTLYFIIIIVILEIIASNSSRLSRIFSRNSLEDNTIKKIIEGTITPDEACKEIERLAFDADNIDKLVIELSKNNIFTTNIQKSVINAQKIYTKNLKTYFGKDTNVKLDDRIVIDILDTQEIDGALTEDEIRFVFKEYGKNDEIVAKLLLYHPLAKKILMKEISPSAKLEYMAQKKYNEKPYWLDKHFWTVSKSIRLFVIIIWMSVITYLLFNYYLPLTKGNSTNENVIFSIIAIILVFLMFPFAKLMNNFLYDMRLNSKKQKNLVLQNYKEITAKIEAEHT